MTGIKDKGVVAMHHGPEQPLEIAMDPTEILSFERQLRGQRASLLQLLGAQRAALPSADEAAAQHLEHVEDTSAREAQERELESALDARESAELAAIDAALERLHAGHYGMCLDCGGAIAPARLHASPEAARCIHCQERHERLAH